MRPFRYFADQYEGNGAPDLAAYANAGHVLYAHKCTEGNVHVDGTYEQRAELAHRQGLTVVLYHYCRPDLGVASNTEASFFWSHARSAFVKGDALALDFELSTSLGPSYGARYIAALWDALTLVSRRPIIIYGSTDFLAEQTLPRWLRHKRYWQAQYASSVNQLATAGPRWAWQFTDGTVGPEPRTLAGIPNGDISQLNLRSALLLRSRFRRRRRGVGNQVGK
jgi:GH25 family lysozyme M1 (1,4-beta-N-acetylmuramidase)